MILTTTTRISHKWLERKPKHELASIILANIDRIELFADENKTEIAELRRALEWYADPRTWNQWLPDSAGDRARKALGLDAQGGAR